MLMTIMKTVLIEVKVKSKLISIVWWYEYSKVYRARLQIHRSLFFGPRKILIQKNLMFYANLKPSNLTNLPIRLVMFYVIFMTIFIIKMEITHNFSVIYISLSLIAFILNCMTSLLHISPITLFCYSNIFIHRNLRRNWYK